ncbi:MAG TPA: glycoside hydrolase family 20 zincin-like fold domain-containing protein, partial [Pyrinomonadaceae bacterium]
MQNSDADILTRRLVFRPALLPTLLFVALLLPVFVARAQTSGAQQVVRVIPQPRQLTPASESFRLTRDVRLVLADARSAEDRFAAEDFAHDVRETAGGLALSIGRTRRKRGTILIGALGLAPVEAALRRANVAAPPDLNAEGYVLSVNAGEVVVAGKTAAGTFYGLQTLKQLVRGDAPDAVISGVRIVDWPQMR